MERSKLALQLGQFGVFREESCHLQLPAWLSTFIGQALTETYCIILDKLTTTFFSFTLL